jgi:hypothetical protein
MTTQLSRPPSSPTGTRAPRRRLRRGARALTVALAVGASATVAAAPPAQAAPALVFMLSSTIDGEKFDFYRTGPTNGYSQEYRVCSTAIDGPGLETCMDYRVEFDARSEEGVLTALDTGELHERRLMTGEQNHVYVRRAAQSAYTPPALPDGARQTEIINLHNADLGFQRFRRADGAEILRAWAPRSAGTVNGAPRVESIDLRTASPGDRANANTFMAQVREAQRQRTTTGNVMVASRWWVGLVGTGASLHAYRYGSHGVGGILMTLGAIAFFFAPRYDAPMAMHNAMRAADDAFAAVWGYDPVSDWADNAR